MTEDTVAGRGPARNTVGFTTPRLEESARKAIHSSPRTADGVPPALHPGAPKLVAPEIVAVVGMFLRTVRV